MTCQNDRDHAEVHRGWLIMAISSHRSKARLRNYIGRPSSEQLRARSDILSDALIERPHQSLQPRLCHPEQSSCSGKFRLSLIHNTLAFNSLFSCSHVKKLACFYEPQFGWIWLNISLSDSFLETTKLQAKVLNSTCRNISVCKLLQNVKFDGFWTLVVWSLWQL